MFLVKVFCSEQIMALYIVHQSGGQTISTINSQVLAKLHLGFEREMLNKEKQSLRFRVSNLLVCHTSC